MAVDDLFANINLWEDVSEEEKAQELERLRVRDSNATIKENLNGKSTQEVLGLTNLKKAIVYKFNAIKCDITDVEDYEDILAESPVMQNTVARGESLLPTFRYLHQDFYLSLVKYSPELNPGVEMHASTRMNRGIFSKIINTPEFIKLRKICRLDRFSAALGAEILGQEAIEIIEDLIAKTKDAEEQRKALQKLMEKEQEIDDILEEQESLDDILKQMQQSGGSPEDLQEVSDMMNENGHTLEEAKAIANALAQQCDDLIQEDGDDIVNAANALGRAMTQATTEIQEVSQYCATWGLGEGGDGKVAFQNKREAIEKIRRSTKLKKMTDAIGRFKESAITEQKKKAKDGAVEIHSTELGDKIQDTLPSERMGLVRQETKLDFYRKLQEKQLLVYSKRAHKQKNKGPIIVCVDTSGSMSGDSEIWSKAMTIGVLEIAEMQKRDFACIIYSSYADEPIIIRKGETAPEKIIQCAEKFHNGGTNFQEPLEKAIELINTSTFKNADILFISDGDCSISDPFLRRYKKIKEEKEFNTQGVLINLGRGHSYDGTMKEFCDKITLVSDVADLKDSDSDINKSIFGSL